MTWQVEVVSCGLCGVFIRHIAAVVRQAKLKHSLGLADVDCSTVLFLTHYCIHNVV